MKKILSLLLLTCLMCSLSAVVLAEDESNVTHLSTIVPAAQYTMTIPADKAVEYGTTEFEIGALSATAISGFQAGKDLKITVNYTSFTCPSASTSIPLKLTWGGIDGTDQKVRRDLESGGAILFKGTDVNAISVFIQNSQGSGGHYRSSCDLTGHIAKNDWGGALAGNYTATITFIAEIVTAST